MEKQENILTEQVSFAKVLKNWADDYSQNKEQGIKTFLVSKLDETLSDNKIIDGQKVSDIIISEIDCYEQSKQDIQNAIESGESKEEWMSTILLQETEGLGKEEQKKVLGTLHNGLMENMDIPVEQVQGEENAPLQSSLIAKSVSNLATGRVMQVLSDESEVEKKEDVGYSDFVEEALKDNSDTELKAMASGVMVVLHKMGKLPLIPQTAPIQAVVNVACFAVDHAKTVTQIARKEISLTEGLSRIARDSFAAIRGILRGGHGKFTAEGIVEALPILEKPMALVNKISQGITNLIGDERVQEKIGMVREQIIPVAQNFAREFVQTSISVVKSVASKITNFLFG
ncbi:MAG: hypothetical protein SO170_03040 [Butyribacter sp.]|nr:hypothetical protein [Butyribacter sp.]